MPREDRRVIFDYSETYNALYKLSRQKPDSPKLKPGAIKKIEEDPLDANKMNAHIENAQTNEKHLVIFSRDFLAASLMMYCRGTGIPLPRSASKTVMLDPDRVTLRVLI